MRLRRALPALAAALTVLLAAASAHAQYVPGPGLAPPPPPPPIFESVPPRPAPDLVWTPGRWVWDGVTWRWRHGRYRSKLGFRDMYVPGHWERDAGAGFRWIPGGMK